MIARVAAPLALPWLGSITSLASTDRIVPGVPFEILVRADGARRTALCHVPKRYDPNQAWPLVLAFHPYLQPNRSWARYVDTPAAAERHGYVLAMPRGSGHMCFRSFESDPTSRSRKPDDIAFVMALVESLGSRLNIDPTRVYAIGHSNGAMFTHSLASTLPGFLAGFVAVSGPPAEGLPLDTVPTPIMMVHGVADKITPWKGPSPNTPKFARYIDVDTTLARWREINGAIAEPDVSRYDRPGDRTSIVRYDWPAPPAQAETVMLKVENGGHRWPDPVKKFYFPFTGEQSCDIEMFAVAWDFLARQRRSISSATR
jgi:polyhydroxybutyrate depolymerase